MFKLVRLFFGFVLLLGLAPVAFAEEAAPAPASAPAPAAPAPKWYETVTVTGLADAYIGYNSNASTTGINNNQTTLFTPDSNEFALSLFELNFEKKPTAEHPTGFYVGLWAGQEAQATLTGPAAKESAFQGVIRQAYGSVLILPPLQLDIGKYATPVSQEVIESNGNWNYTRSFLYNYAEPVLHTGARLTYTVNDALSAQFHVTNGWGNDYNNTSGKCLAVQLAYAPIKALPLVANYMTGSEFNNPAAVLAPPAAGKTLPVAGVGSRSLVNVNGTFNITDTIAVAASFDSGSQSNGSATAGSATWTGWAGYARYSGPLPFLTAIAVRVEGYQDPNGFTTGFVGGQNLTEATLTLEKAVEGALFRLEGRTDSSNQSFFQAAGAANTTSQTTAYFSGVFTF